MDKVQLPKRGFSQHEFEERSERAQNRMHQAKLDALLLTTEPEIRYFTGFQTQFFESPSRPWFVILPAEGKPIAVIPEIGATGMSATWVEDIRTWPAPQPEDDGISLLANALNTLPSRFGQLGAPMGPETFLRMPATNFTLLTSKTTSSFTDCSHLLHHLRFVKSPAEIDKIARACTIASCAFEKLPTTCNIGESELAICRRMKIDLLNRGADSIPYLVAGSGSGGYGSIIMGPTTRQVQAGDVLIIDTGTTFDGYFCDFDRNLAFGYITDNTLQAHDVVYRATDAGLAAALPGATTADIWAAMWKILEDGGSLGNSVGRMGHGLGMQLTEWPSIKPGDDTVLEPGAVLTLEPGMEFAPGQQLVHEENIVITDDGARYLSHRAPKEMPLVLC